MLKQLHKLYATVFNKQLWGKIEGGNIGEDRKKCNVELTRTE